MWSTSRTEFIREKGIHLLFNQTRFVATAALAFSPAAAGQLLDFTTFFDGSVNGQAFEGSGGGSLDLSQQTTSLAEITFDALPRNFSPLAVSLVSNLCSNSFMADDASQNLFDLSGGNYSVTRAFQWVGVEQSAVVIESEVGVIEGLGSGLASFSTLSGFYNGPNDITGVQSYSVTWLPSSAPGEFFESGTVVLERATGDTLIMQFASVFSGLANDLQNTQFGVGTFDTEFDGQTLTVGWQGQFAVPAPASLGPLLCGAVLVGRRRR